MNRKPLTALLLSLGALFAFGLANAQTPNFTDTLQLIDQRSNFRADLSATVALETKDPAAGDDSQQVKMFRRDADDLFLLLIEKPATQLGQGYLQTADGLWFYDPESRQFTYTSTSESFEGSDANNDDFGASTLAGDYEVTGSSEGTLGDFAVWTLELEAKNDEVTYPFKTIWVGKDDSLLLKSEDYSLTKRLLRTSYYPSYTRAGESYIADRMIFSDALVEGKTTSITLTDISAAAIPNSVFTKAYVERVNR